MMRHAKFAAAFASALVEGDYARAHALLAPPLQQQFTPATLRENLYAMFRLYASGEPKNILFDEEFAQTDWPGKLPNDVGWAYVGIEGDDFLEAVTVTIADIDGNHLIRDIIWGRP
jgi:hypothetical protein